MTPEALAALTGEYIYGSGTEARITITIVNGTLMFTGANRTPRGLSHVGDRAFNPVGAPEVRIRFRDNASGMALTVHDPDLILEATRAR
jgi:hypothetical protein